MIGNNKLELNEATIIAAVQMYLNSLTVKPIGRVTSVKRGTDGYSNTFAVELVSDEAPEVAQRIVA